MVSISKISTIPIRTCVKPQVKNVAKVALPTVSGLGVLAGSSMSGMNPPFDVAPLPLGASVEDPFIDQLQYVGHKALDNAEELAGLVGDGIVNIGSNISDGISSIGGHMADAIIDSLDYLPF